MGEDNAEKDLPGSLSEAFVSEPMGTAEEYGRQINMLCYEDGYIVIFGGIPFSFATTNELLNFLAALFRDSQDRAELYNRIIQESSSDITSWSDILTTDDDGSQVDIANMIIEGLARAISLVFRTYGEIYDPLNSCGIAVHKKQG